MKTKKKLRKAIKLYTEAREIEDKADEIFLIERKGCKHFKWSSGGFANCHHPYYISDACDIVVCPHWN